MTTQQPERTSSDLEADIRSARETLVGLLCESQRRNEATTTQVRNLEGMVSDRLRGLIVEVGGVRSFAKLLGVEAKTVRNWRDGRPTKGSKKRKRELPTARSLATVAATFRVSADWLLGLAHNPHQQLDITVPGAVAIAEYVSLLYGLQPPTNLAARSPAYAEWQKQARRVFAEAMRAAREELDIQKIRKDYAAIPARRAAIRGRGKSA